MLHAARSASIPDAIAAPMPASPQLNPAEAFVVGGAAVSKGEECGLPLPPSVSVMRPLTGVDVAVMMFRVASLESHGDECGLPLPPRVSVMNGLAIAAGFESATTSARATTEPESAAAKTATRMSVFTVSSKGADRPPRRFSGRGVCGCLVCPEDPRSGRLAQLDVCLIAAMRHLPYSRWVVRFTGKQLQDALALVYVARPAVDSAQLVELVIEGLAGMVPGEVLGYNERELVSHDLLAAAETPSVTRSRDIAHAVTAFCSEYPLSMEQRHTDPRALRISDFASSRQLHRLDYYDQALRPLAIEHQIRFWVEAPPGIARFYYVSRRSVDGDFTDLERDLLALLRPYLVALHERFDSDVPELAHTDGLTTRETEILCWVARGKTNQEIAALLIVSPHTVRKHLEHVYEKLRVSSRTAAVARAFAPLN